MLPGSFSHGLDDRFRLAEGLHVLLLRNGIGDHSSPRLDTRLITPSDQSADYDIHICIPTVAEVPKGSRVGSAAYVFQLIYDLHASNPVSYTHLTLPTIYSV